MEKEFRKYEKMASEVISGRNVDFFQVKELNKDGEYVNDIVVCSVEGIKPSGERKFFSGAKTKAILVEKLPMMIENSIRYKESEDRINNAKKSGELPTVQIIGRRWFDKVNGNTYHTSEVYVDNKFVDKSLMSYGYDDAYIDTGFKILSKSNIPPFSGLTSQDIRTLYRNDNKNKLLTSVSDGLKRNL